MSDDKKNPKVVFKSHKTDHISTITFLLSLNQIANGIPVDGLGINWVEPWDEVTFTDYQDYATRSPQIENCALGALFRFNMENNRNIGVALMQWVAKDLNFILTKTLEIYLDPPSFIDNAGGGSGSITPTPPNQPAPPLR